MPFLTALDSRAAIKGSRDPLGVQTIWSRFGRQLVGNLTTITTSVRDFSILLLGYYFAEKVADDGGTEGDLAVFLKWEQLAAYARASANNERGFRGTERVWSRLNSGERPRLGTGSESQILGSQKIYGLWGLYSVSARASGLLEGDPARLTQPARDLVEQVYLPILTAGNQRESRAIFNSLRAPTYQLDVAGRDAPMLKAIARMLEKVRRPERELFQKHLLYGDTGAATVTRDIQSTFADLLIGTLDDPDWSVSPESVARLALQARAHGGAGEDLATRLERVRTCELVIAPAAALFQYAMSCDKQTLQQIATRVREHWGTTPRSLINVTDTQSLETDMRAWSGDVESGARWMATARALHAADYQEALIQLLGQNAAIMKARSGAAPWATIREGELHVDFQEEQETGFPSGDSLPSYWRHAYFIDSLRSIAHDLRA